MSRVLSPEDAIRRPHLVEYDHDNPSPYFSDKHIKYFDAIQDGFSRDEIVKIRSIEWFVLNTNSGYYSECAIPGLRYRDNVDVRYARRFNSTAYENMMDEFLSYVPAYFSPDDVDRCHMPAYRLTHTDGSQFYPVVFNGNLPAWRQRFKDCAKHFNTVAGHFEGGKFLLSDGRKLNFIDMDVDWVDRKPYPSDW